MANHLELALLAICILAGHCHCEFGGLQTTSVQEIAEKLIENLKPCSVVVHTNGQKNIDCGVTVPWFGHLYWGGNYAHEHLYSVYTDVRIDTGVVDVHLKGRADKNGISGAVGGKVDFIAVVEAEVGITNDKTVSGTLAAGVKLTEAAQAKILVKGDTNGYVSAELRGSVDLGFADASAHVGINQDLVVKGGVSSGVKLGEESTLSVGITGDTEGHTIGRVDGKLGYNGKSVHGFASMDGSGTVTHDAFVRLGTARGPKPEL